MNSDHSSEFAALDAKYWTEAPKPPQGLVAPEVFWYIHYKAFTYLSIGPDKYRELDAFQCPPDHWTEAKFHVVTHGCEQIVQWRGLTAEQPLDGIGVAGFYALLHLFHFELISQAARLGESGMILDVMRMKHMEDAREITLYNRVEAPGMHEEPFPE